MRTLALGALFLFACSKPAPVADRAEGGLVAAAAAAPPVPDAAPVVRTKTYQASFAHFVKNRLFECVDVRIELDIPDGAGPEWKPKQDPLVDLKKRMKEVTPIQDPCGVAFSDRPVLASCTHLTKGDGGASEASASFYDFEDVGLTDEHMADCLKESGRWNAISRDSAEWRKAKLDHDMRNLRKAAGKLQE